MKKIIFTFIISALFTQTSPAQNADSNDAMIAHLNFLGYTCTKKEKSIEARHETKLSFDIISYRGGYIFKGWFNKSKQADTQPAKYALLLNAINCESTVSRFYFDKDGDLIIEAWYPGKYGKDTFTAFITAWEQDFISAIQKHFNEMKIYIIN